MVTAGATNLHRRSKLRPRSARPTSIASSTKRGHVYCTLCSSSFGCDSYSIDRHVVSPSHSQRMHEKVKLLSDSKHTTKQITDFFARPEHERMQGGYPGAEH